MLTKDETLILRAILDIGEDAYGASIIHQISLDGQRRMLPGTFFLIASEMVEKGYLTSWIGNATPDRPNRPKKFYKITAPGKAALVESLVTCHSARFKLNLLPSF